MIGDKMRELREADNILLRQLAATLEMDTAMLSKMERGDRFFRKEDIVALSKIFKQAQQELLTLWLADKVFQFAENKEQALQALQIAEEELLKLKK